MIENLDSIPNLMVYLNLLSWFLIYVLARVWFEAWREHKMPKWILLVPSIAIQICLAIFYNNDLALVWAYNIDGGATLPYGRAWFWLNPFYGGEFTYLWFILGWNLAFLGIMFFLVSGEKLRVQWVYWTQILNIVLISAHNPQSIVPMSFVYLVPALGPIMLVIAALIKLPFGWVPMFANRHWQCAFGSSAPTGAPYWECLHFTPGYFLVSSDAWYNFAVYLILGYMILQSVKIWRNNRSIRKIVFDFLNTTRTAGIVINIMMKTGLYERQVVKLIKTLSGDVAIDVGANDGYFTRILRERFNHVIPIDPNPKYRHYPLMALADYNGQAFLFTDSKSNRSSSLLPRFKYHGDTYSSNQKIVTQVRRLDNCKKLIDFVKIDVEGAEFEVIMGMSGARARSVLVELHDESREETLIELLASQGFSVSKIDRNHFFGRK